ncbi:hypothetical protein LTR37_005750 [Vermiconidia calcicola]|uniref:Uncharacterized protein n=1 Tax=Vermiconidia calcicola TaxID=1690605 RepID=A0ACC3NIX9_9PEZI|nr:hypothetical protein LTR37_005750 [Vermiconidia calcicola]
MRYIDQRGSVSAVANALGFEGNYAFTAALATYFVCTLQMPFSKRLTVSAILNCRLILAAPIAFRLYYLYPSNAANHPLTASIVTEVVMGTALMFASITCLKPFIRPFDAVAFNSATRSVGLFRYTAEPIVSRNDRYLELSEMRSGIHKKAGVTTHIRSIEDDCKSDQEDLIPDACKPPPTFRPVGVDHVVQARSTAPEHGFDGNGRDGRAIFKTESWTVSYGKA